MDFRDFRDVFVMAAKRELMCSEAGTNLPTAGFCVSDLYQEVLA